MTHLHQLDIPSECICGHKLPPTIPIHERADETCFTTCGGCGKNIELPFKNPALIDRSKVNLRPVVLDEAKKCVMHDRNRDCGDPEDNFTTIGDFWTTYLQAAGVLPKDKKIAHHQVGAMMVLFKMARQAVSPQKLDHYVDSAGYSACAADCAKAQ